MKVIPMPDNLKFVEELGLTKEFYDKLNSLTLEQIFMIISPTRDIAYLENVGIISGRFHWSLLATVSTLNNFLKPK